MDLKKLNVMIDTETLSTRPTATVLSIGAVMFDENGVRPDGFYATISMRDSSTYNLHIMKSTIEWWKEQPEEVFRQATKDAEPLRTVMTKFNEWYGGYSRDTWSCGAAFDIPILENLYDVTELQEPWKYWDVKCYRTVKGMMPDGALVPVRSGNHHNALDDATFQAEHLINIWKAING